MIVPCAFFQTPGAKKKRAPKATRKRAPKATRKRAR
jgi:hypothetical protein